MAERSGIEMIEELLNEVKAIRAEMKVLDQNIKKVANAVKLIELADKVLNTPMDSFGRANAAKPKAIAATPPEKPKAVAAKPPEKIAVAMEPAKAQNVRFNFQQEPKAAEAVCMCEGKMIISSGTNKTPLPDIAVKIFNDKDVLVKETKTNRAGVWMSKLPPGKYVASCDGKFAGKVLNPVNISFIVQDGMKKLEVK